MPAAEPARVALVTMPFGGVDRPALGISLLKALLAERGITCDIHYLNLLFADRIGLPPYEELAMFDGRRLCGEQLFAREVFGGQMPEGPPPDPLKRRSSALRSLWDKIEIWQHLCESVGPFLDECETCLPWGGYRVVGFSTTFEQNMASLALARRIKARWPGTVVVFGGANCEGEMGLELHRQFQWIDFVCSGEGDVVFPLLVERLLAGAPPPKAPGLIVRSRGQSRIAGLTALPVTDLDRLPYPDFDDYFRQVGRSAVGAQAELVIPFESSRGCWYGARQHCTFCGLNGETIAYRSKSAGRVLDEIRHLVRRYGIRHLTASDNILESHYFQSLLPELAQGDLNLLIHYEVKANLRREQIQLLKRAGVERLQPGIESLSTSILKLMQKGCTALQNIQLLKWASGLGVNVAWNFLMGFPGEDPQEYVRMAEWIPALVHLQPPQGFGLIRLDRFSPYFSSPEHFGLTRVRAAASYAAVYPFPQTVLRRLAYYFDFDYADGRDPAGYVGPLQETILYWCEHYCPFAFTLRSSEQALFLRDRRPGAVQEVGALTGAERAAYEYLDSAHSLSSLRTHLNALGHPVDEDSLRGQLDAWVQKRWIVRDGDWFLSLAVPMDELL